MLKLLLQVKEMMDNIRQAFREEVSNLTWIDDTTRPKVFEKVIVGQSLMNPPEGNRHRLPGYTVSQNKGSIKTQYKTAGGTGFYVSKLTNK